VADPNIQKALDALHGELLSEIIALRSVTAILLRIVLDERSEAEKRAALNLCLTGAKTAKLKGFTPEDEFAIRAQAEQKITALVMARIEPSA
jgi:hypothetical protein